MAKNIKKLKLIIYSISLGLLIIISLTFIFFYHPIKIQEEDYKKISYNQITNWGKDNNLANFIVSFSESCRIFNNKPKDYVITQNPVVTTAKKWQDVCSKLNNTKLENDPEIINFIEQNFTPYLVGNKGEAHFTAYYRIELDGSLTKTKEYKYPVYKTPTDLIQVNLGDFDPNLKGEVIFGKAVNGKLVHYYSRAEIEQGILKHKNLELVWLKNKYDAFLLHVQGSGTVELTNGKKIYLSYTTKNGLKFSGITSYMLKNNYKTSNSSLKGIAANYEFFTNNPEKVDEVLNNNNSFIFFNIVDQSKWVGAFGTNLYKERTVAVDPKYEALGVPLWLTITNPINNEEINRMVVANDIGSAIKGLGRVDFYWGLGEKAGEIAGQTNQYSNLYMFLPN